MNNELSLVVGVSQPDAISRNGQLLLLVPEHFVHLAFILARRKRTDRVDEDYKQNTDNPGSDK